MKLKDLVISAVALLALAVVIGANTYSGGVSGSADGNALLKSNGNRSVAGSLVTDDGTTVAVNANKVTITAATGATSIASTLNVVGAITAQAGDNYAADTASSDTYTVALSPALTAYATGQMITFKAVTANTGACTLDVNSLGAKALKRAVSTDPGDNFIKAGSIVIAVYDGTAFQMLQPAAQ